MQKHSSLSDRRGSLAKALVDSDAAEVVVAVLPSDPHERPFSSEFFGALGVLRRVQRSVVRGTRTLGVALTESYIPKDAMDGSDRTVPQRMEDEKSAAAAGWEELRL